MQLVQFDGLQGLAEPFQLQLVELFSPASRLLQSAEGGLDGAELSAE